jgi:hypothetical protein
MMYRRNSIEQQMERLRDRVIRVETTNYILIAILVAVLVKEFF